MLVHLGWVSAPELEEAEKAQGLARGAYRHVTEKVSVGLFIVLESNGGDSA